MRPSLTSKQIVDGLLGNLRRKVASALDEAKATALDQARTISPRPGIRHPYATGEYAGSWVWRGTRLVNTADHAPYTDTGTTRYGGKGTAKPWIAEGSTKYSDQIAISVAATLRKALGRKR